MAENPYAVSSEENFGDAAELTGPQRTKSLIAGGLVGFFVCLMLVVFFFGVLFLFTGRVDLRTVPSGLLAVAGGFCLVISVGLAVIVGINATFRIQRMFRRRSVQRARQTELARDVAIAQEKITMRKTP